MTGARRERRRLDQALVERGLAETRAKAQALIRAGSVLVEERPCDKPAELVDLDAQIRVREALRYVSRGGYKLEAALDAFGVDPTGRVCVDLGASTGGFTDCLLQRGAARVYAIDVGYGQLAWSLRQDPRVVVMERTNARHLTGLPEPVSLLTGDLSFISLTLMLPAILAIGGAGAEAVLLVKPQFEAGREGVGKGGVVRDPEARAAAIQRVLDACVAHQVQVLGGVDSPLPGAKQGNVEHLVHLRLPAGPALG